MKILIQILETIIGSNASLPSWANTLIRVIIILAVAVSAFFLPSCTVSHVVRQSSTTTTTKSDGTSESVATTIEYNQSGTGSK